MTEQTTDDVMPVREWFLPTPLHGVAARWHGKRGRSIAAVLRVCHEQGLKVVDTWSSRHLGDVDAGWTLRFNVVAIEWAPGLMLIYTAYPAKPEASYFTTACSGMYADSVFEGIDSDMDGDGMFDTEIARAWMKLFLK